MSTTATKHNVVNGLDVDALKEVIEQVKSDPAKGLVEFRVKSAWKGQTRSETSIDAYKIGGKEVQRHFKLSVDEPLELLGENTAANPQEYLMTAFNACIMVGYVAGAAVNAITLSKVEIETSGQLDLRGFLGIDPNVKPGYESIQYVVKIKGNGTEEQFRKIHENVMKTSPNYFNVSRPVRIDSELIVES
ncbi:MAG TPA: OsmC family protein [Candidatus Binatia bacterium]|nr:OsmC family protein [Candidatus Binatia bacterium]